MDTVFINILEAYRNKRLYVELNYDFFIDAYAAYLNSENTHVDVPQLKVGQEFVIEITQCIIYCPMTYVLVPLELKIKSVFESEQLPDFNYQDSIFENDIKTEVLQTNQVEINSFSNPGS